MKCLDLSGNIVSSRIINMRTTEEVKLQNKIVSWGEVMVNYSKLFGTDCRIAYHDNDVVNVREDEKLEFVLKRDSMEFSHYVKEFISNYDGEFLENPAYLNASIVYVSLEDIENFILESKSIQGIEYVEPNFYNQLDFIPNDEYYAEYQWDLTLIGMESAWDYEIGSNDIKVAVVDTGIDYTHPDLNRNYLPLGYDWVNDDDDPMDDHSHGTQCAGTIAGVINNIEGISGMANVSLVAEKAFGASGMGSMLDCRAAIMHAVDIGVDIISCSWGSTSLSQTLIEGLDYAINHNVLVIAAAGNENSSIPHYPAAYPKVLAVSATDREDLKANFSNFGSWIDIAAPGEDIFSTVPYDIQGTYYDLAYGTSMAAPHVSGLAALLKSAYPTSNASQIESLIYESAVDLGIPGFDPYYGHGRINVSNLFGPDKSPPSYSNLTESADPLELGDTEIITIDVIDPSGINQVLIEFDLNNRSMTNLGGDKWQFSFWTPSSIGNHTYMIHMEDKRKNWGFVEGSIQVVDTTNPTCKLLTNHTEPLELGNSTVFLVKATDISGIKQVLFKCKVLNDMMSNLGGDVWQLKKFSPSKVGMYNYEILVEDNFDNKASINGSIEVKDTTSPLPPILTDYPHGEVIGKIIFDWEEVYDHSGIEYFRLIIDNESNPLYTPGYVFEIIIENTGLESSYYELEVDLPQGTYYFFLYQIDGVGLQSISSSGTFIILAPNNDIKNNSDINFILIWTFLGCAMVVIPGYIAVKKIKAKKPQIVLYDPESKDLKNKVKYLSDKREENEKEAKDSIKYGNYANATYLYEQCRKISNELFKLGVLNEQERVKYYSNMQSKTALAQNTEKSFAISNINRLMIQYFDQIGINYYSEPEIYLEGDNMINGLILNDTKFLQKSLLNPKNSSNLIKELNINLGSINDIKGLQFIYTNDLSQRNIINICLNYQNPELFLFIVGIRWYPSFKKRETISIPQDNRIKYEENIRVINSNLFAILIGFDDKYRDILFKIIDSNKIFECNNINRHNIDELKADLRRNRWFILT
ncbi:MAG: S8 family peptidase [Promethearchaeota archaeon]